ncbi:sodium/sulphate symporter [Candidatus Desulforudis audaxviator MP104C]|uniref:Sodium-dependent dicarboxylate transporter SdcS n=1 Tax=Desulforudis audaxviator (strain MP104C) TaxID=477974 RepID=B1I2T8_DESAP|nr:DASS family sodium-coupled anion symporter [Candidatus Desulforudis audaxviator]ACA59307.1 sodium/sulphate symporter [Candidatus Desulforudis audaxviator MP104C]
MSLVKRVLDNGREAGLRNTKAAVFGFLFSWVVFFSVLNLVPVSEALTPEGRAALAVMAWAMVIWVSEALPMGISGLGICVLLMLTGALPKVPDAFSGFTTSVTFLVLGCFILAALMQVTGLDRRIALGIVSRVKPRVGSVLGGLMGAHFVTAILVPATNARGAVFLPIVTSIIRLLGDSPDAKRGRKALAMAGIGMAALAAGIITMHSHMSNVIIAQALNEAVGPGTMTWGKWLWMHWPLLGIFPVMWLWVTWALKCAKVEIPGGMDEIRKQKDALGTMSWNEWVVLICTSIAVFLWATDSWHKLGIHTVTLLVVMAILIPGVVSINWKRVQQNVIWGTWLLLCGSLSLVTAFAKTGVDKWLASQLVAITPAWGWVAVTLLICVVVQIIRLGIISNVAAVTLMAPVVVAMAPLLDLNTVAFSLVVLNIDSYAFILPISVTACLIAYGTEEFTFTEFMKIGAPFTFFVILYMVFVMVPWWAVCGYPIWEPIN